jgi:DNA-binding response OmpR family regulator
MIATASSDTAKTAKVLLVEDEEELQTLFAELLKSEGYSVKVCGDGQSALDSILEDNFDLVLLDIRLPKMDGLEVLSQVHEKKKKNGSKIVLLTNLAENDTIAKALKFGVSGYMIKSRFTPDQFLEEVKKYLAK